MKRPLEIRTLFLDIGGVLLTNGWDHLARRRAAGKFKLDWAQMDGRHRLVFEIYERGMLTLGQYLDLVVFNRPRPFTRAQFQEFMFSQSKSLPNMIDFIRRLKSNHGLKIVAVSNEARELNAHRIRTFGLDGFVDVFISSCFVHARKPDPAIFNLALDVAQSNVSRVLFIDNTPMFTLIAQERGIHSVLHTDFASTRQKLAALGLTDAEGAR